MIFSLTMWHYVTNVLYNFKVCSENNMVIDQYDFHYVPKYNPIKNLIFKKIFS